MTALDELLAESSRPRVSRPRPSAKPEECAPVPRALGDGKGQSTGRWLDDVTPKRGWTFVEIIDTREAYERVGEDPISCPGGTNEWGDPLFICQMCQREELRYVHVVSHPDHDDLCVGCICDGHMTGDPFGARFEHDQAKALRGAVETAERVFWARVKDPTQSYYSDTLKGFRVNIGGGWAMQVFRGKFGGWSAGIMKNGNAPVFLGSYVETPEAAIDLIEPIYLQIVYRSKRTKGCDPERKKARSRSPGPSLTTSEQT